jgi:hypothetical protein
MDDDLQARIQHEIAELRAAYPRITGCRAALDEWKEGADTRCSLRLDLRLPQHQSLISGEPRNSAYAALRAAFDAAAQHLASIAAQGCPG